MNQLKIGQIVKVIKKNSEYFNKFGTIICNYEDGEFKLKFSDDNEVIFLTHELQLVTSKQKSKWKYTRKYIYWLFQHSTLTTIELMGMLLAKKFPYKEEKISSVNGGTCCKCGEKKIYIVGGNIHKCKKTIKSKDIDNLDPILSKNGLCCYNSKREIVFKINEIINFLSKEKHD